MRLHENKRLFQEAIIAASRSVEDGGLGISDHFLEKDYWICRSLKMMALSDVEGRTVFKGGTSLSKAHGIGRRFSEDIDVAISETWTMSGNQLKSLIKRTSKAMTEGLTEVQMPGTSKGSRYHKAYYAYPSILKTDSVGAIKSGQLLVEINAFANPYPCVRKEISSFLTQFLTLNPNGAQFMDEYDMQPFEITVLDKRRTLTEKVVSIIRCSLAENYVGELSAKIRHFYDLCYLMQDAECIDYVATGSFADDFSALLHHDQQSFDKPEGWRQKTAAQSPLVTSLSETWKRLQPTYMAELPQLAYQEIPQVEKVELALDSIIKRIVDSQN